LRGGRSGGSAFDEIQNVLLGDTAAGAGAGYFSEIDVVLARQLANQGGRADV
jgi:hypothetical protein